MTTLPAIDNFATKGLTAQPYLDGSIFMEGYGSKGAKPRPFNYRLAAKAYHHWAYAALNLNSGAAAGVPKRMFVRKRAGGGGARKLYETRSVDRSTLHYLRGRGELKPSPAVIAKVAAFGGEVDEVVEPHPAMTLLAKPNEDDSGYDMDYARFSDQQWSGNFWWYVVDNRLGTPTTLYRLPPQWTTVIPNTQKTGNRRVAGYVYGKNMACEVEFSADEVDHFLCYNPDDLYYGMGWYQAGWQALGLHNAKRTEDLAFKDNMSRPDWVLSTDGGDPKTMERLESAMKTKFSGPENSGKFLVTNGKLTATALQWEVKELGTPTRLIEEIAAISGVPVAMLLSNDPNKSGGETARLSWYRGAVRTMCLRDEQKLNQRYVSRFAGSDDYFIAYDPTCFEDRAVIVKEVIALTSGGVISPNEGRQELGYRDADGADFLYPPAGNTGGSAAAMGDLSAQQNDERPDRKGVRVAKGVARMPKADNTNAREESEAQFKRDVFAAALKDPTAGDAIINMMNVPVLMDDVGIARKENMDVPVLPIVSVTGPVVNGKVIKVGDTVIGGAAGDPPPEQITITRDATAGDGTP